MTGPGRRLAADGAWVVSLDPDRSAAALGAPGTAYSAAGPGLRVLFSGSLFESTTLAKRLIVSGEEALNPAALALAAFRQLGERWLEALGGHFAVVVYDSERRTVFAGRDRMGMHPLFYAHAGAAIVLSNSLEALTAHPSVPGALNRVAMADHLVHRWPDHTETYFAAVRRIPAGHVLEVRGAATRLRRYWDPASQPSLEVGEGEAQDLFDRAFGRAVGRCLDQGPAGIFLSGGLDSISVAAVATDAARRDGAALPAAMSLGFPDPECDEEAIQRGAAATLGIDHCFVTFDEAVGREGLLRRAVEMSARWPAPLLNTWLPAYERLARTARERNRTTVLTGTGGDEWLGVTPYLAADLLRKGQFAALVRFVRSVQRSSRMSKAEVLRATLWRFGLRPIAAMSLARAAPWWFHARRRRRLIESTPAWVAPDRALREQMDARAADTLRPSPPVNGSFYEQEMRTAVDHALTALEHEESFEFGRRTGVTMLHPFCDADLVELLYRMPPRLLMKGGRSKGLVRETVARRFPALGFERQRKVNATAFYRGILRREGQAAWEAVGHATALGDLGIIDQRQVAAALGTWLTDQESPESYRIWSVLNLAAWTQPRHGGRAAGRQPQ